jgi:ribonuclease P protein subunit POP4
MPQQQPPPAAAPGSANIVNAFLGRAHSPESAARIYNERIKGRPLYLKPSAAESGGSSDARHARRAVRLRRLAERRRRLKPQPLSAREKRALSVYDIPKEEQKWAVYQPLRRLWRGYIAEVLGEGGAPSVAGGGAALARLASADFHGAVLEVVRSRCVGRVGLKGIVVRDSKFAFTIVTERDEVKLVPKEHTIFRFEAPFPARPSEKQDEEGVTPLGTEPARKKDLVFELHGDQFQHRAPDRANKKFKTHFLPDL